MLAPATLTVLPTYGPFIAQAQAARVTVPAVPGNGVFIELFNGIGGGAVPAPNVVSNCTGVAFDVGMVRVFDDAEIFIFRQFLQLENDFRVAN